jgi:hypothetical protein
VGRAEVDVTSLGSKDPAWAAQALSCSSCAWLRQCEHTIIHYNSITVIKAGGTQRQEGVLPTKFTLRVIRER